MKNDVSSAPLTTLKAWLRVISATSSQSSAEGSRNIIGKGRCGCGSFGAAQQGGCSRMVTVWREAVSQRPRLLVNCAEHDFAWRKMKALQSGASAISPTAAIGYEVQASCYQALLCFHDRAG